ncbi:hypothetical protein FGG08_003713 [Glutinoglossum americanum]|uniref:Actin-like ATPase domain-containing protein n=1 Tax=Glutinoglossum americanum TaxID=1670608 RepID=A0A9P8I1Y1_9PEZI|nr:hypothetical protein FGG08_003713 [Glutinoglossum americanum]
MAIPHRIVVGVDFGTTFSALAWASSHSPDQIEIIKNWPSSGQLVGAQAPTEIAYEDGSTSTFSWGYDIPPQKRKVREDPEASAEGYFWQFGLADIVTLFPRAGDVVQAGPRGRSFEHATSSGPDGGGRDIMDITKIDFVLTVPAIWSDSAKKSNFAAPLRSTHLLNAFTVAATDCIAGGAETEDAARRAGIGNEHELEILSEPEAAALYTLKHSDRSSSMIKVNDRIVVCDAGGGTVDLISYDVLQIQPLIVRECAAGTGDYCGSTFIDRNFESLFAFRMGRHYDALRPEHRQQVIKNFETAKTAFRDAPGQHKFFVNVPTVDEIREAGVEGGHFGISRQEMRSLFDPVIDQIIDLIKHQVMTVSQGAQRVNSILLVGGFGESEYLYKRVSQWAGRFDVQVIQPREASTAIVRGAVLKGIEPQGGPGRAQFERVARRSYGAPTSQLFIPGRHLEEDAFFDKFTGKKMARNQISWFIRKHQPVTDDHTFSYAFSRHFSTVTPWTDTLVSCDADQPPPRHDPTIVRKHCAIISDLTHLKKSNFKRRWRNWRPYYAAEYELIMNLKNNNLGFALQYKGKKYGAANVDVNFD